MRISVNGARLFVDVDGAKLIADGPVMRERPTIVLLHGGPGFDHSNFKPAYAQLTDLAQLVYLDHRGNGRSDRDDPSTWNLDAWAEDVKGLCDVLEIERPIILGWSFGGFVAMRYAALYPDHLSKLILQSTATRMDIDRIVEGFRGVGGDEPAAAAAAFWSAPSDETMAGYMEHCLGLYSTEPLDPDIIARCVLNIELLKGFDGEREMDLGAGLGAVTVPTLVLAGAQDPITPLSAAEEIVAALPPASATYQVFERSGHFIQLTEPEAFFAAVRSFVAG